MSLKTAFGILFLFNILIANASEIVIDATNLEKNSAFFITESDQLNMIPESGIVKITITNLPTIIRIVSIEKRKVITHKTIWLKGNILFLKGSIEKNTVEVLPKDMGNILGDDIENKWIKSKIDDLSESEITHPFLVYIATNLQFQKTESLKNIAAQIPEKERGFWAAVKITSYLDDLESIGYDASINRFEHLSAINKNGEKVRYDKPNDKFLLIDFSSSGCKPCLEDIDKLVKLQKDFENELDILSLWDDPKQEAWLNIAKKQKDKIVWTSLRDDSQAIFKTFEIDVYPTYLLVAPNGQIVKKWKGSGIDKVGKYLK